MKLYISIALAIILSSCYNQRKASKQVDKALDKYPAVVAEIARDNFPCVDTGVDSSDLVRARAEKDSLFRALGYTSGTLTNLRNVINNLTVDSAARANCAELLNKVYAYTDSIERKNTELLAFIQRLSNRPPAQVIKYREDSAKIFLADQQAAKAIAEAADWRAKYNAEKELRQELQKRIRGTVLVPWWVFLIIGAAIVFYFRKSIKSLFMKSIIPAIAICAILSGCGHFRSDPSVSVWASGMWLLFWIPFLGSLWIGYRSYRSWKSGSNIIGPGGNITNREGGRIPLWKHGKFRIALALQIFAWLVVWYVNSNHWK